MILSLHPEVADSLLSKYRDYVMGIERIFKKHIDIRKEWGYKRAEYHFFSGTTKKEIELWF